LGGGGGKRQRSLSTEVPMELFANVSWPKARLTKVVILEMNMKRKNVIWLVTSFGRVKPVICWSRMGGDSIV